MLVRLPFLMASQDKPRQVNLDDYIGSDKTDEIEQKNNRTEYSIEQVNNEYNWRIKVRKNIVASLIGIVIVLLLVYNIIDDRLDVENDIVLVKEDTTLITEQKIEQIGKLRESVQNRHENLVIPILTLILGYYFGSGNKDR